MLYALQDYAYHAATPMRLAARTDVAAVVYQEAGPVDDLSGKDAQPWALTADDQTVAAFLALTGQMAGVVNR